MRNEKKNSRKQANELDGKTWLRYSVSVWSDIRKTKEETELKHPAMFPSVLAHRLIACFTPPDASFVAYLLGLITARGKISEDSDVRRIIIEFPYKSLEIEGISARFDTDNSIKLGLQQIQERILDVTGADVSISSTDSSIRLVLRFFRNTMVWRNILMHTREDTGYEHFRVPDVFFSSNIRTDWKREYLRGFADVAGNIRRANRYVDGSDRVRLDVLNYQTNWEMPVLLCTLLEEHLKIPIQLITWGHPNMGRNFREHQINIFAVPY